MVVASPTYKATYTGILKLFLDQIPTGSLVGVVAFPLMLGGAWLHSLAPEVFLRPVLVELGATCPAKGLYLLDTDYLDPPGLDSWVAEARGFLQVTHDGRLHLAVALDGAGWHPAAWREPSARPAELLTARVLGRSGPPGRAGPRSTS